MVSLSNVIKVDGNFFFRLHSHRWTKLSIIMSKMIEMEVEWGVRRKKNIQLFLFLFLCLPCHAQTDDCSGSILSQCREQSPQLHMIKLSGFPSPTVSVYELYLLILVSLYGEKIVCIVFKFIYSYACYKREICIAVKL